MRTLLGWLTGWVAIICWVGPLAWGDAKVEQESLGPDGDVLGCSISPHGGHVAVFAAKGSRFVVDLDGVEGPKIEALQPAIYGNPFQAVTNWVGHVPVLFSDDGAHCAYIAKVGDEYVVFLDGKELTRGSLASTGANNTVPLTFSHGGKHLFFMDNSGGKFHIVVDGKPGPPTGFPMPLVISDDGEHYAYTGFTNNNIGNGIPNWAVIDGRQVNYFGSDLQYTGRNVIISRMSADGAEIVAINGKPAIKAAGVTPMWISPDGGLLAVVITPKNGEPTILSINGKEVPDARGLNIQKVFFSPDGKRYAACCATKTGSNFMIIDGKKGEVYQHIPLQVPSLATLNHWMFATGVQPPSWDGVQRPVPGFTADSSKFVYVAVQGGRQFMVLEDQESSSFTEIHPTLSMAGGRIGAIGVAPNGKQHVIIDGKDTEYGPTQSPSGLVRITSLLFTDDGTRSVFVNGQRLVLDGMTLPGNGASERFVISPDNKHIAYLGNDAGTNCLFIDGKVIDSAGTVGMTNRMFFTADSRHLISLKSINLQSMNTKDSTLLSLDGKPVTHYADPAGEPAVNFETTGDGVITFIARTDGNLRRFRITPSPDTNVSTIVAAGATLKDK